VAFVSVTADFGPVATAICRGVILTIAFDVRTGS
jgi:hypothetical protein